MLLGDAEVATFIENDGRVVAVVDDGVAHQCGALLPARAIDILLGIAGRHGLEQAHTVARLDVLLPRADVHPADEIASRLHHQTVAVVAHPCRDGESHAWPLVGGALGIAMHHQHAVVEVEHAILELRLAESRACDHHVVGGIQFVTQIGFDGIEIAIAP